MTAPAMDMNLSQPAIQLASLRVTFGEYIAVADADISVARGQSFGLVGESGSGKSTILRALCGLVPLTGGTAVLNAGGQNFALGARVPKRLRRVVQMVFQDPYGSLHPRHTVDRLLSEPLAIHGIGDRPRRVLAALDEVGLGPSFRYRYPHQLSGGQRQRIAIARALILEPEIVLLDEPTSALDASVQAEILNLLETIRRARGLTYLMVSHDLAVITHMCSRIAVMQAGRIVTTVDAADFAARRVDHPYAQALIAASEGFRKTR